MSLTVRQRVQRLPWDPGKHRLLPGCNFHVEGKLIDGLVAILKHSLCYPQVELLANKNNLSSCSSVQLHPGLTLDICEASKNCLWSLQNNFTCVLTSVVEMENCKYWLQCYNKEKTGPVIEYKGLCIQHSPKWRFGEKRLNRRSKCSLSILVSYRCACVSLSIKQRYR